MHILDADFGGHDRQGGMDDYPAFNVAGQRQQIRQIFGVIFNVESQGSPRPSSRQARRA